MCLEGVHGRAKVGSGIFPTFKVLCVNLWPLSDALSAAGDILQAVPVNKASALQGATERRRTRRRALAAKLHHLGYSPHSGYLCSSLWPRPFHTQASRATCLPPIHSHRPVMNDFSRQILIKWRASCRSLQANVYKQLLAECFPCSPRLTPSFVSYSHTSRQVGQEVFTFLYSCS